MDSCHHTPLSRVSAYIVLCMIFLALAWSCGTNGGGKSFKPVHLSAPVPPAMMDADAKTDYVCRHFFDGVTHPAPGMPCTETMVSGIQVDELEQAVSNYCSMLGNMELGKARNYASALAEDMIACAQADSLSNVLTVFAGILERYMYDPNSPVRDEDVYGAYASTMSHCALYPVSKRRAYEMDAKLCGMNSRGSMAKDFQFTTAEGKVYSLYGIRAEYTVLFFSNPGCHACKDIIDALSSDAKIVDAVMKGKMAVVNVYIDEDLAAWMEYMPIYPSYWYNGFDHNGVIRADELYNVRAIPSLYLLDSGKKVILKDTTVEKLMKNLPWE